ncbi:MAG: hydrolase 2, exosortase A system-associated [Rhodoferax sp.]|nr:hydrolase 2, exosortase A system-associated [Rhodoferax sp.]
MPIQPEAFFLAADAGRAGQRMCLFHPPDTAPSIGSVLYVPPFAEEMNKARRMAALQARAMAQAGFAVLQMDLLGCGDSSGDSTDATWQDWVGDVVQGARWLRERSAAALWLWGLRTGCLLAADAARHLPGPSHFLFWSPMASGKTQWQQFLRLKLVGDMLGGNTKGVSEALRQQLAAGENIEVAGYGVSPGMARGLEHAVLAPPPLASADPVRRLEWLELSTREDASLSPVAQKALRQWEQAGFAVRSRIALGPSFWQTTEIEDAPALISASLEAIGSAAHSPASAE